MNWIQQRWDKRAVYRYHFLQSTYISSVWAWFLTFWGKAAEPFLCVSVLYSGAKLMPGVSTPATVDTVMFIGQMLALDIGGLSLGKIAQQLEREGNEQQARFIKKVSFFLIGLMIANVVLATVQHLFPQIDPIWISGIESSLLIVRSIMAVIYGYIIYNLHPHEKQDTAVVKSSDVKSQFEEFVNMLTALENKLTARTVNMSEELTNLLNAQAVNIQMALRDELTRTHHAQMVTMNHQIASVLSEHNTHLDIQIKTALREQVVTITESLDQQLETRLTELTTHLSEQLTTRKSVSKKLTAGETGVLTPHEPVNKKRPSNITLLTVNTAEKKRLVEECLVNNPGIRNADICRVMKEQGVDVTPAYISMIRNGKRA